MLEKEVVKRLRVLSDSSGTGDRGITQDLFSFFDYTAATRPTY